MLNYHALNEFIDQARERIRRLDAQANIKLERFFFDARNLLFFEKFKVLDFEHDSENETLKFEKSFLD